MQFDILCAWTFSPKKPPWPLWFDSCKRPNPISDHSVFAFWLVAYGRFECISNMMSTKVWFRGLKKCKREPTFEFGCGHLGFYTRVQARVNLFFRGKSRAAKILGTRIHCCAMEVVIIEIEEKMVNFVGKTSCKWTILLNYQWKYDVPRSVAFVAKLIHRCSCKSLECWPCFALACVAGAWK